MEAWGKEKLQNLPRTEDKLKVEITIKKENTTCSRTDAHIFIL